MERWVFWVQFVIIIILLSFILVRDHGVKDFIKNIFSWAKKKIRIAKIKSALKSAIDNKNKMIPKLGENYWKTGMENDRDNDIILKLNSLKIEDDFLNKSLKQNILQIKDQKENKEKSLHEKNNTLNEYNNKKKPLEIELKKLEKEFESVDKTIKEQKKLIVKTEKNIAANNKEKKKIDLDPPGYSTENEKKTKTRILDDKNNDLKNEILNIKNKIEDLRSENPSAQKRVHELNAKISHFNLKTNTIKDEIIALKKQKDEEIRKLEAEKKQLESDLKLKKIDMNKNFKNLGHILIDERVDITQLKDIYSQIDNIEKTISNLTKKLIKINKSDNLE